MPDLQMNLPRADASRFHPLFQQGVEVEVRVGGTLQRLLEEDFGLDPQYVSGRITTVFLDARPIDKFDSTQIRDGSTLALSGAMPGLVGATLRRGGHLAAMRGGISYRGEGDQKEGVGTIRIKLFNLLLPDLAPILLERGIRLRASELEGIVGPQPQLQGAEGSTSVRLFIRFEE